MTTWLEYSRHVAAVVAGALVAEPEAAVGICHVRGWGRVVGKAALLEAVAMLAALVAAWKGQEGW